MAKPPRGFDFVEATVAHVGVPGQEEQDWLEALLFFKRWYAQGGKAWLTGLAESADQWPLPLVVGCPECLLQLVRKCLVWHPSARMAVAGAKVHSFLQPPGQAPLRVRLAMKPGKKGVGTIAEADLDPDLLLHLQTCPSWNSLAKKRLKTAATHSKGARGDEAVLGFKTEVAGVADEEHHPKRRRLGCEANLSLIPSERLAAFVQAIRNKWRPRLQQLGGKKREAVRADGMPARIYAKSGQPILHEDFADIAFAYASIQLMQPGAGGAVGAQTAVAPCCMRP